MDFEKGNNKAKVIANREKEIGKIRKAVSMGKIVTMVTYVFQDNAEKRLGRIMEILLEIYGRMDLMEVSYTSVKEMVINATKANLKRVIFNDRDPNSLEESAYQNLMVQLRNQLSEKHLIKHEKTFRQKEYAVYISFAHSQERIIIQVRNNFALYPQEEKRIREKAAVAMQVQDLVQFYLERGDSTEGAGMGITLVSFLLKQSGIDPRCFSIYSTAEDKTIARLELPLIPEYTPKRKGYDSLLEQGKISANELRKNQFVKYRIPADN